MFHEAFLFLSCGLDETTGVYPWNGHTLCYAMYSPNVGGSVGCSLILLHLPLVRTLPSDHPKPQRGG
jgi:hypothetical protein